MARASEQAVGTEETKKKREEKIHIKTQKQKKYTGKHINPSQ
jgi:hypothetical protein